MIEGSTPSSGGEEWFCQENKVVILKVQRMRTYMSRLGLALAFSSIAALSGCSQGEEARSAAPFESEAADVNVESLFGPGVRVCIFNRSSSRMVTEFAMETDSSGEGVIWEGKGKSCGYGDDKSQAWDLLGNIVATSPDRTWTFNARNPGIGYPELLLSRSNLDLRCSVRSFFAVGESEAQDDGLNIVTTTRLPDSDMKEFEVVITDSALGSVVKGRPACK